MECPLLHYHRLIAIPRTTFDQRLLAMRRYSATFLTLPLALLVAACGEQTPDYEATDLSDNVLLA